MQRNVFEMTFLWPNESRSAIRETGADFHDAMLIALLRCPREARVLRIEPLAVPFNMFARVDEEDADERGSEG